MDFNYWHQSKIRKDVGDKHYHTHLFLSSKGNNSVCAQRHKHHIFYEIS